MQEEPGISFSLCAQDGRLKWQSPPARLPGVAGDVHIWRTLTDKLTDMRIGQLRQCLSRDEIDRADRFQFPMHKRRFIACRGMLRMILGEYRDELPAQIRFEYGPFGKPGVAGARATPLHFNLSHRDGLALIAITPVGPIGIDVEAANQPIEIDSIAREFLRPHDAARITALSANNRRAEFFRLWTRQEAIVKASGEGLGALDGPRRFDRMKELAGQCEIRELSLDAPYIGALALFHGGFAN